MVAVWKKKLKLLMNGNSEIIMKKLKINYIKIDWKKTIIN